MWVENLVMYSCDGSRQGSRWLHCQVHDREWGRRKKETYNRDRASAWNPCSTMSYLSDFGQVTTSLCQFSHFTKWKNIAWVGGPTDGMRWGTLSKIRNRKVLDHGSYYHFWIHKQFTQISFRALTRQTYVKFNIPVTSGLKKTFFLTGTCNLLQRALN